MLTGMSERPYRRAPAGCEIVAVEADVHRADGDGQPLELSNESGEAAGQRDASGVKADEHDAVGASIPLEDLVGDPGERPSGRLGVENGGRAVSLSRLRQEKKPLAGQQEVRVEARAAGALA